MILVASVIIRFLIFLLFTTFLFYSCNKSSLIEHTINGETMGTTYQIIIHSSDNLDETRLQSKIDSILFNFNQSMSTYLDDSEISMFNKMEADSSLQVSDDFYHVLEKSFNYHDISDGLFDVTINPLYEIWGFRDSDYISEPTQNQIDSVLSFIGMNHIKFPNSRFISKSHSKTTINLGAIAKGYAVDILSDYLILFRYFISTNSR